MKVSALKLPLITKQNLPHSHPLQNIFEKSSETQQEIQEIESEHTQVSQLDKWTAKNYISSGKKKSKFLSLLYRQNNIRRSKKQQTVSQSSLIVEVKLYLLSLPATLKKVHQINYNSICINLEYCSGIYQNFYNQILNTLARYKKTLERKLRDLQQNIRIERLEHIKKIESDKNYVSQIDNVRRDIAIKEQQLQPIKTTIQSIENARKAAYKESLLQGYDVRSEGLIWIVRELGYFPKNSQFPSFLNQMEVSYIRTKFDAERSQKKRKQDIKQEHLIQTFNKSPKQITEILCRKKKRQLSMIKEGDLLSQLHQQNFSKIINQRHKYLTQDILKIASQQIPLKSTKYEIIYKETAKRLKKYCSNYIHKKNEKKSKYSQKK